VPVPALITKLDLDRYNVEAPLAPELYAPARVRIRLKQQMGAPSRPVVKTGDHVAAGQLVAEAGGPVSARQHASISGAVTRVDNELIEITQ
jgi:electron transport complex protein RnfC